MANILLFLLDAVRPRRFGKYAVPFDLWESGYFYPSFCTGPCYMTSRPALNKMYDAARQHLDLVAKFPLEDVLFTGIFRQAANVTSIVKSTHGECRHYTTEKETFMMRDFIKKDMTKNPEKSQVDVLINFGKEYDVSIIPKKPSSIW